jgi:hypothetical protein
VFYVQALILGTLAIILFVPYLPRYPLMALSLMWVLGVNAIYFRYGPVGQLGFYSNDQEIHEFLLGKLGWGGRPTTFEDILDRRYVFLGPAYLLTISGIKSILAMKFVALVSLLLNAVVLRRYFEQNSMRVRPLYVWLATGPVVFFFSLLALRETMMVACVTYVFVGKNPSLRLLGIVVLGLLRPHMGIAIVLGLLVTWFVRRIPRAWYFATLFGILIGTIAIGAVTYSFALAVYHDRDFLFYGVFTKEQTFQIFANFTGLQFLSADLIAIERSLVDLWLPRIVFPETIVVPVLFSIALFVPQKSIDAFKFSVLASIGFYLGITTTSEFNSFRQNLPFISVMAIVVIRTLLEHRQDASPDDLESKQLVA